MGTSGKKGGDIVNLSLAVSSAYRQWIGLDFALLWSGGGGGEN